MNTRRRLLRALLGAPLLLVANRAVIARPQPPAPTAQPPAPTTQTILYETYVAGMQHHKPYRRGILKSVVVGSDLVLKREPINEFDHRAIAVHLENGLRLGYLPKWVNHIPSRLIDDGHELHCTITKFNSDDEPWHMVKVAIILTAS